MTNLLRLRCQCQLLQWLQWLQWGVTFSQVVWLIDCWLEISATNKSISSERTSEDLVFCWEGKLWTSCLLTCCSRKGWAAEKSSKTEVFWQNKEHAPRSELVLLHQGTGYTCKNHLQATLLPQLQKMRTQPESTYIAHNMFGQIKMEIPWYDSRHTLISRKGDGKPRMIGGQFVVVRVGVHRLSVSPNTSHPMLQICSKLLHGNSTPSLNS
jgi:hypothetical protein